MPGDLHTHTNFSDGSSDIELLPLLARRAGLTSLAVSDHDTELCIQYASSPGGSGCTPDSGCGERVLILAEAGGSTCFAIARS